MAYLFLSIIFILITVINFTPISVFLSFDDFFNVTISLPFVDVIVYSSSQREAKKREKRIGIDLKRIALTIRAAKHALDLLLKSARLTVYQSNNAALLNNNLSSRGKRIIFSVFITYLASKSGILITNEGASSANKKNTAVSALIETRVFRVFFALITFLSIRFLPKKEYGVVR